MPRPFISFSKILVILSLLIPTIAGSAVISTSAIAAQTGQEADSFINITFKACPDAGDETAPPAGCDEIVEAPETAMLTAAPDWVQPVSDLERNEDGSYTAPYMNSGVPGGEGMGLVNFFSPDFNYFTFDGVDTLTRWYGAVSDVAEGETREITVYYWNGADGLIVPAENEMVINVATCDSGIDPAQDPTGCEPYAGDVPDMYIGSAPLADVEPDDYLTRDGGTLTYAGLPAYTQMQVVVHQPLAGYGDVLVTGQAEEVEDNSATAYLLRNERRVIDVYFFAPDGSVRTPEPTQAPESGTLRLLLLSCPAGVVPHDDPAKCTDAIQDDGTATVTFPESGETVPMTSFERDETGAYLITGIESSVTIAGITPVTRDRLATDADQINGQEIVYNIDPGQTRDGRLYYYDEP